MASHKYLVGQSVSLRPSRLSSLVGSQACKITRLLPIEGVAKDGDLALRSLDQWDTETRRTAEEFR
jgi:hypothetical protein